MSSTFKTYYQNEDFRKRHNQYMKEKIPCEVCGINISRHNKTKHSKSVKHSKALQQKQKLQEEEKERNDLSFLLNTVDKLMEKIKELKSI